MAIAKIQGSQNIYAQAHDRLKRENPNFDEGIWDYLLDKNDKDDIDTYVAAVDIVKNTDSAELYNFNGKESTPMLRFMKVLNEAFGKADETVKEYFIPWNADEIMTWTNEAKAYDIQYQKDLAKANENGYALQYSYDNKAAAQLEVGGTMQKLTHYEYINKLIENENLKIDNDAWSKFVYEIKTPEFWKGVGDNLLRLGGSVLSVGANILIGADRALSTLAYLILPGTANLLAGDWNEFIRGVNYYSSKGVFTDIDYLSLADWTYELESKYSFFRDEYGNLTRAGDIFVNAARTIGEMVALSFVGGAVGQAVKAVSPVLQVAANGSATIVGYTGKVAKLGKLSVDLGKVVSTAVYYTPLAARSMAANATKIASEGQSVSTGALIGHTAASTAAEIAIEIALGRIFGITGLDLSRLGGKSSPKIVKNFWGILGKIGKDVFQEGTEEALQEMSNVAIDEAFGKVVDEDFGELSTLDGQAIGDAFIIGCLVSAGHASVKLVNDVAKADPLVIEHEDGSVTEMSRLETLVYRHNMQAYLSSVNEAGNVMADAYATMYESLPKTEKLSYLRGDLSLAETELATVEKDIAEFSARNTQENADPKNEQEAQGEQGTDAEAGTRRGRFQEFRENLARRRAEVLKAKIAKIKSEITKLEGSAKKEFKQYKKDRNKSGRNASSFNDVVSTFRDGFEGMYAATRMLKSFSNQIGEERFKAAEAILKKIDEKLEKGNFTPAMIDAKLDELNELLALKGVTVTKKDLAKLKKRGLLKVEGQYDLTKLAEKVLEEKKKPKRDEAETAETAEDTVTEENTEEVTTEETADLSDPLTRQLIEIANGSSVNHVIVTEDGSGAVELESEEAIVVPEAELQLGATEVFKDIAEQKAVENLLNSTFKGNVISTIVKTYQEIYGEDKTSEDAIYAVCFDPTFFATMLEGDLGKGVPIADCNMYQFLSQLQSLFDSIVPEDVKTQIYKERVSAMKKAMTETLFEYVKLQPHADFRLDIFTDAQKAELIRLHESYQFANRLVSGKGTNSDKILITTRIDKLSIDEEIKNKLKADVFSNKPTLVRQALSAIDEEYRNAFEGIYNGTIYMPSSNRKNKIFNHFLYRQGLDISVLNTGTAEELKLAKVDKVGVKGLIALRGDLFKRFTNGRYGLQLVDVKDAKADPKNSSFAVDDLVVRIVELKGALSRHHSIDDLASDVTGYAAEDNVAPKVSYRAGRNTQLVNGILKEDVQKDYYVIDDVISEPTLLSEDIQKKIEAEYGELNSENAYLFLKSYFIEKTGTISISLLQNGDVAFVDLKDSIKMINKDAVAKIKSGSTKLSEVINPEYNIPFFDEITIVFDKKGGSIANEGRSGKDKYVLHLLDGSKSKVLGSNYFLQQRTVELAHEAQHAIQIANKLNYGNDGKILNRLDEDQVETVVKEVKAHLPELFKDAEVSDESIVNDFLYYASGEAEAYGRSFSDAVKFYPVVVKLNNDKSTTITLPWGTVINTNDAKAEAKIRRTVRDTSSGAVSDVDFKLNSLFYRLDLLSSNLWELAHNPEEIDMINTGIDVTETFHPFNGEGIDVPEDFIGEKGYIKIVNGTLEFTKTGPDESRLLRERIKSIAEFCIENNVEIDAFNKDFWDQLEEDFGDYLVFDYRVKPEVIAERYNDIFNVIKKVVYPPTFFSQMEVAINGMKDGKQGAQSVVSYLKGRGVKDEEIKWSGIKEFLEGKKSVTKQELQEFAIMSRLEITERELRDESTFWSMYSVADEDKDPYSSSNYREILFNLPNSNYSNDAMEMHWHQPGVLMHARVHDRNQYGMRVLFVDELQSDWHNALQKQEGDRKERDRLTEREKVVGDEYRELRAKEDELSKKLEDIISSTFVHENNPRYVTQYIMHHDDPTHAITWLFNKYHMPAENNELFDLVPEIVKTRDAVRKSHDEYREISDKLNSMGALLYENRREELEARVEELKLKEQEAKTLLEEAAKDAEDLTREISAFIRQEAPSVSNPHGEAKNFVVAAQKGELDTQERLLDKYKISTEIRDKLSKFGEYWGRLYRMRRSIEDDLDRILNTLTVLNELAPDAPFADTYQDYVMKRLIRMAAEEGYDAIAWTHSDTQMARWNPMDRTNEEMNTNLGYSLTGDPDAVAFKQAYINVYDKRMVKIADKIGSKFGAKVVPMTLQDAGYVEPISRLDDLEEVLTERWGLEPDVYREYDETGHEIFIYENPDTGEVVRGDEMYEDRYNHNRAWALDITPEMRKSVIYDGQPMYDIKDVAPQDVDESLKATLNERGDIKDLRRLFDQFNSDDDIGQLFNRIYGIYEKLPDVEAFGIRFRDADPEFEVAPFMNAKTAAYVKGRTIVYDSSFLADKNVDPQYRATVILHEMIHGLTLRYCNAITDGLRTGRIIDPDTGDVIPIERNADILSIKPNKKWSNQLKGALALAQIYEQMKKGDENQSKTYGDTELAEFVAELANPDYRRRLASRNLWTKILDCIKRILGISKTDALSNAMEALYKILDGYEAKRPAFKFNPRIAEVLKNLHRAPGRRGRKPKAERENNAPKKIKFQSEAAKDYEAAKELFESENYRRRVSEEDGMNTNLRAFKGQQLSKELRGFILEAWYTNDGGVNYAIWDQILRGTLTRTAIYDAVYNMVPGKRNDETLRLINKHFFHNPAINSVEELDDYVSKTNQYYGIYMTYVSKKISPELLEVDRPGLYDAFMALINQDEKLAKLFESYAYPPLVLSEDKRKNEPKTQAPAELLLNADPKQLRRLWLKGYDGSIKSIGAICRAAMTLGNYKYKSSTKLNTRSLDSKSRGKNGEGRSLADKIKDTADSADHATVEDMFYIRLYTETDELYESGEDAIEVLASLGSNPEEIKAHILHALGGRNIPPELLESGLKKLAFMRETGVIDGEIKHGTDIVAAIEAANKVLSSREPRNIVRNAKRIADKIRVLMNLKNVYAESRRKFLSKNSDIFNEDFELREEAYKAPTEKGAIRYLDPGKLLALEKRLSELKNKIMQGHYDKRYISLLKSTEDYHKQLKKLVADFEKGKPTEFVITNDEVRVDAGREVPAILQTMLKTEIKTLADTTVQRFSQENEKHVKVSMKKFIDRNVDALNSLTQDDVDALLDYYANTSVIPSTNQAVLYLSVQQFLLYYVLKSNDENNGKYALTETQIYQAENRLKIIARLAGTAQTNWREILRDMNTLEERTRASMKFYDANISEETDKRLIQAVVSGDPEVIERVRKDAIKELRKLYKNRKTTFWEKCVNLQRVMMLSSPGTWLRNWFTNLAIGGVKTKTGSIVLPGLDDITGLLGLLPKTRQSKKLSEKDLDKKGNPRRFKMYTQYRMAGTKIKPEYKEFIKTALVKSGYLKLISTGLSKWNSLSLKGNANNAPAQILGFIRRGIEGELFESRGLSSAIIGVMMSDKPWVESTAMRYLGKMLTEDNVDISKGLNEEVIMYVADAYVMAAQDFMHTPNIFSKLEYWAKNHARKRWSPGKVDFYYFLYKQVAPFAAASWNWFVDKLNYSPIGLAIGIRDLCKLEATVDKIIEARSKGLQIRSQRFAEYLAKRNIGKGIIGSVILMIGMLLRAAGKAGIDDEDDKYKIWVGDGADRIYIDMSNFHITSSLTVGMAIMDGVTDIKSGEVSLDKLLDIFSNVADELLNDFILTDVFNTFRRYNSIGDTGVGLLTDSIGMFTPKFLGTISSVFINKRIKYSSGFQGDLEYLAGSVFAPLRRTAGAIYWINPYTGEPELTNANHWMTIVNKFSPFKINKYAVNEYEEIAINLGITSEMLTGRYTINDEKVNLSSADLEEASIFYGKRNNADLRDLVNDKTKYRVQMANGMYRELIYSKMTEQQKKAVINRIMDDNSQLAKIYILTKDGKYKYYASDAEYRKLRELGISNNIYRKTAKLEGFVKN